MPAGVFAGIAVVILPVAPEMEPDFVTNPGIGFAPNASIIYTVGLFTCDHGTINLLVLEQLFISALVMLSNGAGV